MMFIIHGLPMVAKYQDVKMLLQRECHLNDFILDNLVPDEDGSMKVKLEVADEMEGAHVIKCLDGFQCGGNVLYVVPVEISGHPNQMEPGPGPDPGGPGGPLNVGTESGPNQRDPNPPLMIVVSDPPPMEFNDPQQNAPFQQQMPQNVPQPFDPQRNFPMNDFPMQSHPNQMEPGPGPDPVGPGGPLNVGTESGPNQRDPNPPLMTVVSDPPPMEFNDPQQNAPFQQQMPQNVPQPFDPQRNFPMNDFPMQGHPNQMEPGPGPDPGGPGGPLNVGTECGPNQRDPNPPLITVVSDPPPMEFNDPQQNAPFQQQVKKKNFKGPIQFDDNTPRSGYHGSSTPWQVVVKKDKFMSPKQFDDNAPGPAYHGSSTPWQVIMPQNVPQPFDPQRNFPMNDFPMQSHPNQMEPGPGPDPVGPGGPLNVSTESGPNQRDMNPPLMTVVSDPPPMEFNDPQQNAPFQQQMPQNVPQPFDPQRNFPMNDFPMQGHPNQMEPGPGPDPGGPGGPLNVGTECGPNQRDPNPPLITVVSDPPPMEFNDPQQNAPFQQQVKKKNFKGPIQFDDNTPRSGYHGSSTPWQVVVKKDKFMSPKQFDDNAPGPAYHGSSTPWQVINPTNKPSQQPGRNVSPGRRMSPPDNRMPPSDHRMPPNDQRMPRDGSLPPKDDRMGPNNHIMHDRSMSTRSRSGRRMSPSDKRRSPDRRMHSPGRRSPRRITPERQMRYSPGRHPDKSDRLKQVRPAYEPDSKAANEALYSNGYRTNTHEPVHIPIVPGAERISPDINLPGDKYGAKKEEERNRIVSRLSDHGEKRISPRASRSPGRRDWSPIRDRYRRHSPLPRSPRRSWALENIHIDHREKMDPIILAKREKAVKEISKRIIEKYITLVEPEIKSRVIDEIKDRIFNMMYEVYRDQDIPPFKLIIKFNSKFGPHVEGRIFHEAALKFSKQYRGMEKPATGASDIPAKAARRTPEPVVNADRDRRGHDRREFFDRHDYRHEERPRSRHSDEYRNKMDPNNLAKREKAVNDISRRIIEKYITLVEPEVKSRVINEIKDRIFNMMYEVYRDQDISPLKMIIKFSTKFDGRVQGRIFHEAALKFSDQYRGMKRRATGASEIPAKAARRTPEPVVNAVPMPPVCQGYQPITSMDDDKVSCHLYLCKDNFQPIRYDEANNLKEFLITEIFNTTATSNWSPSFVFKELHTPTRYELITENTNSKDWLLALDFSSFTDFNVLVYTSEELWSYERIAIWLPGHSKCKSIDPFTKLQLQNRKVEGIDIGKWKFVKSIVTVNGTRLYVDVPPSAARVLETKKTLSYELQQVSVFLKAVAVDKTAFDAGLNEPSVTDVSTVMSAIQNSPMPTLENELDVVKITVKGCKKLSVTHARKIKDMLVFELFKYLRKNGQSSTDFIKYGLCLPNAFGVVPLNSESKTWLIQLNMGKLCRKPLVVIGEEQQAKSIQLKAYISDIRKNVNKMPYVFERLKQSNRRVKGLHFNLWKPLGMSYDSDSIRLTLSVDMESVETIASLNFTLDYLDEHNDEKLKTVTFKSDDGEKKIIDLIKEYKEEQNDSHEVAYVDLVSSETDDDVVCLGEEDDVKAVHSVDSN